MPLRGVGVEAAPLSVAGETSSGKASPLPLGRFCEPPLRRVSSFLTDPSDSPSVAVRLAEPIWGGMVHVGLMVHCVQLQALLERETVGNDRAAPQQLEEVCASQPRVRELLDAIWADVEVLRPGLGSPMPLLDQTGLSATCPLVAHFLGDPNKIYRDESVPSVREYLEHVAALDQLQCIAVQLRDDVCSGRHKYTAHKIALLYHGINHTKLARDVLRKRIEQHFEDVKDATEASDGEPHLPPELVEWITGLCDEVCSLIRGIPPSLRSRLEPTTQYLRYFTP